MAELHFVEARKEEQSGLPDGFFPNLILLFSHEQVFPRRVYLLLLSFHITGRPLLVDPELFYTTTIAKQEISTFPLSEVKIVAY